jgi:FtsZ-binding cell division protein ZapB
MKYPPNKQLIYLVALVLLLAALIGLQSCNSEKKALKPYKEVNSDVDTSFKAKKIELISRVCAINFPMQEKTIVKDSITTKIVRIQDNNLVNKLKAELAKKCKDINIDSIYNLLPFDTIYIDHYHTKTITQKDTITLKQMAKSNDELHSKVNTLNAENTSLNKHIEDLTKDVNQSHKNSNKWKLYFFLLLGAGIVYKVAKIYLSKSFTLPKIF